MREYTYLLLNFIFFLPLILFIFIRFSKSIKKYLKLILVNEIFAVIIFFTLDILAVNWGAWGYDYSQTIGIIFGKSVIEELIWAILLCFVTATVVGVLADAEEKHIPLTKLLQSPKVRNRRRKK